MMNQAIALNATIKWKTIALILMSDKDITEVNQVYFNKSEPTDVISFVYPPMDKKDTFSGEILISIDRAVSEGKRRGSISRELSLYIAHGCLHLIGQKDETSEDLTKMHHLEKSLLNNYFKQNSELELVSLDST